MRIISSEFDTRGESRGRDGFTLIELLVVIAIIAILAALLLPALSKAKNSAQAIMCLNNTKQLQLSWQMYADDFNGKLPLNAENANVSDGWILGNMMSASDATNLNLLRRGVLFPYNKSVNDYRCPADKRKSRTSGLSFRVRSYAMNCYMNGDNIGKTLGGYSGFQVNRKLTDIIHPNPSSAFVFVEESENTIDDGHFGFYPEGTKFNWLNIPAQWHGGANFVFADGHASFRKWRDGATLAISSSILDPSPDHADIRYVQSILARRIDGTRP